MSWNPALDPVCPEGDEVDRIAFEIVPRARDLGDFEVRRALPSVQRQMVGPFIFFDQAGPAEFLTGQGVDVRPHPHIGLGTVTYLYRGEFFHRDSTGAAQVVEPGAVNWMIAGKGVTHSERTRPATRKGPHELFGVQTWMALPEDQEDRAPSFAHHGKQSLPVIEAEGKQVRLTFCIENEAGFHLRETPLSKDQRVRDMGDGWMHITATVVDSAMLEWWLRGFGSAVRDVSRQSPAGRAPAVREKRACT